MGYESTAVHGCKGFGCRCSQARLESSQIERIIVEVTVQPVIAIINLSFVSTNWKWQKGFSSSQCMTCSDHMGYK